MARPNHMNDDQYESFSHFRCDFQHLLADQESKFPVTMADAEAKLAAEIARLEMELQKARHVSKQQHLQQELSAVKNVLDEDEFMIIQDLIDDTGDEEYEEVTENSYDESYEEVEEYSDDEEEYSEYEEVTDYEDDDEDGDDDDDAETVDQPSQSAPQPTTSRPTATKQEEPAAATQRKSPMESLRSAVQSGHQNLRRTPWRRKQEEASAKKAENVAPAVKTPTPKNDAATPAGKKKVRPPPSKGGKPVARVDPKEGPKPTKKNPLSRLIKRNDEQHEKRASGVVPEAAPEPPKEETAAEKKKKIIRRLVKKNTAGKPAESKKPNASTTNAPFKRRPIPNLQPSAAGEETIFETLLGQKLITSPKLHKSSTKGCMKDQDLICFYFGAVWKSDCKRFNALLKDFYYSVAKQTNLEVVYISADRSLIEFKDCFTTMPFLAMPAGTTSLKNDLTKALKVIEMPALVVLDDEGSVVTVEGVQKLQQLEKGNAKQALQLVDRWKKTRPIPIADVQLDKTLLHGTMERGTIYWQG